MPFKSEAQRKFMNAAGARGEISQKTVDEYNKASKGMKLPKRIGKHYEGGEVKSKDDKEKDNYKKLKQMMGVK